MLHDEAHMSLRLAQVLHMKTVMCASSSILLRITPHSVFVQSIFVLLTSDYSMFNWMPQKALWQRLNWYKNNFSISAMHLQCYILSL